MTTDSLLTIYRLLFRHFGPRHWWPADSPMEMAIGAILTQNTAWRNVERAIGQLRQVIALTSAELLGLDAQRLEELIRPAGFFRQKARRLQQFAGHLQKYHAGRLESLLDQPLEQARLELLQLNGIGPETADAILLYAGGHPSFVIDAYTRRVLLRYGLIAADPGYEPLRRRFMELLPADPQLFNEYHALLVELCKTCCTRRSPACPACPLADHCATGRLHPEVADRRKH